MATPRLDARSRALLDDDRHARMRELYAYWERARGEQDLPSRDDIEPLDIPHLLPNVFLVDVVPGSPPRYRFRLIGTAIAEREGELTGRYFDELDPALYAGTAAQQYHDAVAGRLTVRNDSLHWMGRKHIPYDVLLLPLGDAEGVVMLLGFAEYF